jgi:hypothetical protein
MYVEHIFLPSNIILEWGRREFPGYGRRLFGQRHYQYMVMEINSVPDPEARQWLTKWLSDLFHADNPRFKPDLFAQAVAEKRRYSASPSFQQRHFYYLAQAVREIDDPHVHDFVRDWLAKVVGGTNYYFKSHTWNEFVSRGRKPPEPTPIVSEAYYGSAPGFGNRGHSGFGKKFFRRAHILYIAGCLHRVEDEAVRDHLTNWFASIFKLDNPQFPTEAFIEAVAKAGPSQRWNSAVPTFQQRHFYYLAHEVAEIQDIHERTFVCDWLAQNVGSTNEYFQVERWRKYCHLEPKDYERRHVAHYRAKARGDKVIPETPWQEQSRLEREASKQLTPEEWHAHATSHAEVEGELAGHDLQYLVKPDGEYVIYDKTTGKEHWSVKQPNYTWPHAR